MAAMTDVQFAAIVEAAAEAATKAAVPAAVEAAMAAVAAMTEPVKEEAPVEAPKAPAKKAKNGCDRDPKGRFLPKGDAPKAAKAEKAPKAPKADAPKGKDKELTPAQIANRELAKALRAVGKRANGDDWSAAKALVAAGKTPEEAAKLA